jgi:hypothetical protein
MFGSNVHLFTNNEDLRTSLVTLSEFVCDIAQVKFDAFVANVTRVDYCHDWRLTRESVNEYLWALRNVSFRRMKRHLIDNETIELRNMGQTITFYDKFAERSAMSLKQLCSKEEVLASRGILRLEVRYKDTRACGRHARKMGVTARTAEALLLGDVPHRTITSTLEGLGLNKPIPSNSLRYQLLRDYCGNDGAKYVRLAGFLT